MIQRVLRQLFKSQQSRFVGVLMVTLLTIFLGAGQAQVSTASVNGTVQDNTGAVIPGAKVSLVQTQTGFKTETVSGSEGAFRISSIPIGPYVMSVSRDGFAHYKQDGIVLTVGQVASFQISLTVGAATQDIVVTAEIPAVVSTDNTILCLR